MTMALKVAMDCSTVVPGFVPGIRAFAPYYFQDVDGRDKCQP
jgi:hypothetical protein